jgi:hypothetical protein
MFKLVKNRSLINFLFVGASHLTIIRQTFKLKCSLPNTSKTGLANKFRGLCCDGKRRQRRRRRSKTTTRVKLHFFAVFDRMSEKITSGDQVRLNEKVKICLRKCLCKLNESHLFSSSYLEPFACFRSLSFTSGRHN